MTAIEPAAPVAPSTRTDLPGVKGTRACSTIQDDMAGFMVAATVAGSADAGSGMAARGSMRMRSASVWPLGPPT
ncbi:MAG TPA: hypothetical protein VN619_04250 [Lacisediminihabitans sp.]|nr:hypothetical protein [Lacisediminihabitans sp.]HXD61119.1 hypothetical protein [Lacisediminihabitans sp.]